jgi:ribosomal protein L16 Arg81 hydroxylase
MLGNQKEPSDDRSSLDRMLQNVGVEDFLSKSYEKNYLHISGRPDSYFHDLFTQDVAEQILWMHESHIREFVRFHNDGRDVVTPSDVGPLDVANWAFVEYGRGTTIIMNALEDYHLPIAHFVRSLAITLEARVSAAAYLTPRGARAFRVHFDTHDVLIAQIEGSKIYDLFLDSEIPFLPLRRQQTEVNAERLGSPFATIKLVPGDVLYIPRGMVHVAKTDDDHSIHLTFSLHPSKVGDIAASVIEIASELNPLLRRSLAGEINESEITDLVSALATVLGVPLTVNEVRSRLRERFIATLRPLPSERLRSHASVEAVEPDDWLTKSAGSPCSIVVTRAEVLIGFPGLGVVRDQNRSATRIGMPLVAEPILRFIESRREPFRVSDLPGPLSEPSKLTIVRVLMKEGLLQVASKRPKVKAVRCGDYKAD